VPIRTHTVLSLLTLVAVTLIAAAAHAESPAQFCARVGNDDAVRDIPASLALQARALFHIDNAGDVTTLVSFRCMNHKVMVCYVGANLPCTKANTSRNIPAVTQYCRTHPGESVPAVVTGHDSIYEWNCRGNEAHPDSQIWHLDPRGFVAEVWKQVP
jgi:hypothetical protein